LGKIPLFSCLVAEPAESKPTAQLASMSVGPGMQSFIWLPFHNFCNTGSGVPYRKLSDDLLHELSVRFPRESRIQVSFFVHQLALQSLGLNRTMLWTLCSSFVLTASPIATPVNQLHPIATVTSGPAMGITTFAARLMTSLAVFVENRYVPQFASRHLFLSAGSSKGGVWSAA